MAFRRRLGLRASTFAIVCASIGCSTSSSNPDEIVVFAASSLADALRVVERSFESEHPSWDVQLAFAGSQVLRLQIEQGARADVFASADRAHVQALLDAGIASGPRRFASNELTVITPSTDRARVGTFSDLARAERIAAGSETVPIGRYTELLLERVADLEPGLATQIRGRIVTRESNVRLVRAKVELGEADAAIVYRTDANSPGVRAVPVPPRYAVRADYEVALIDAGEGQGGSLFLDYLLGPVGSRVLAEHGFLPPVD